MRAPVGTKMLMAKKNAKRTTPAAQGNRYKANAAARAIRLLSPQRRGIHNGRLIEASSTSGTSATALTGHGWSEPVPASKAVTGRPLRPTSAMEGCPTSLRGRAGHND
jgi:hypothetical protein